MSFGDVLRVPIKAIRKYPKILLPAVLSWVPSTLILFVVYDMLGKSNEAFSFIRTASFNFNKQFLMSIFWTFFPYLSILLGIAVIYTLIDIFFVSIYTRITKGYYDKRINLSEIFSKSKGDMLPLLWTYFLIFLILSGVTVGLVGVGIIFFPLGLILTFLGIIPISILAIAYLFEIPPVVVLEEKSGFEAIKRSKELSKGNILTILGLVLIVGFISSFVNSIASNIPFLGHYLSLLVMTIFTTWQIMLPTVYYKNYIIS